MEANTSGGIGADGGKNDTHDIEVSPSRANSITTLQAKVVRAKKRIQEEQRRRDENVEEYLKMAAVAQRNQLPAVKALFEKRNTKAATHIAALQRKLERYHQDLQEIEVESQKLASPNRNANKSSVGSPTNTIQDNSNSNVPHVGSEASGSSTASSHRTSKGRLQHVSHGIKSVSGNLKDGITGISGTVISKPREIASYLLKQKFGSADNIQSAISRESDNAHPSGQYHGSAHIPHEIGMGGSGGLSTTQPAVTGEEEVGGSECSESAQSSSLGHDMRNNSSIHNPSDLAILLQQLNELREEFSNVREDLENFKTQAQADSIFTCQGLQEERFRAERLEEQVNDLTELHQAETGNLKQALADAEEKLSYQSEERLRDLAEMLESFQTKISRLEQQQQQLVTIEGIENSAARALAVKLVNVGLTMLQLLLLLVATISSALAPFLGSRIRLFASVIIGLGAFLIHRKWPQAQEIILDFWTDLLNRI